MPIDARLPKEIRADIRAGRLNAVTAGLVAARVYWPSRNSRNS